MIMKPCYYIGCPNLVEKGAYCEEHKQQVATQYNKFVRDPKIQAMYDSPWWRRERRIFLNAHPLCECEECTKHDRTTAATMVDHKIPHNGDIKLFRDKSNWQAMSLSCHNTKTKKEQSNGR